MRLENFMIIIINYFVFIKIIEYFFITDIFYLLYRKANLNKKTPCVNDLFQQSKNKDK